MSTFAQRLEQAIIEYAASHVAFTLGGSPEDVNRTGDALRNLIHGEINRIGDALKGVASCATCEACRNAALRTLDNDYTPDNVAGELLMRAVEQTLPADKAPGKPSYNRTLADRLESAAAIACDSECEGRCVECPADLMREAATAIKRPATEPTGLE